MAQLRCYDTFGSGRAEQNRDTGGGACASILVMHATPKARRIATSLATTLTTLTLMSACGDDGEPSSAGASGAPVYSSDPQSFGGQPRCQGFAVGLGKYQNTGAFLVFLDEVAFNGERIGCNN